ncbi:hypothetical protein BDQ12DRAFT_773579 [Crucibulum laeve]|uniref:Uncharacterized protein n=1 Tax=Crucibulum laeve TaxID=68775 RepID=A0A5C3LJB8_9AGAR|nr:hypothetical protein BDQ12DRAFT_773579 [Crucibulum laeve]
MPKRAAFTPKPSIEKLPLAVRKDIWDNFESKKTDFESEIGKLLDTAFTININANAVWAYAEGLSASSAGGTFSGYVEGFISALKGYLEKYGDEGKSYFNSAVTQSELALVVNSLADEAETISADVKDGVFRILFRQDRLGYNQSWLNDHFLNAIEAVPREGFSLIAKHSIENNFNADIGSLTQEIGEILALPDIIIDANFEENYAALNCKDDKSWQSNFGAATFAYFSDGLKYQLVRQGFRGDDMLQEGFAEMVTSKTIKLRVVNATTGGLTNETIIENGIVYLQTTPDRWHYNVNEAGQQLLDLL